MRGSNTFNSLFGDIIDTPSVPVRKGRSAEEIARRDELLLLRYFYYGIYTNKRYEKILDQLNNEFFIAQARIVCILAEYTEELRALRKNPPSVSDLSKRYPHWRW